MGKQQSKLRVVGDLTCKEEHVEFVQRELYELVRKSRVELGCIEYIAHQDIDRPNHFILIGEWESLSHWEAHAETNHFKAFMESTRSMLEGGGVAVTKLKRLHVTEHTPIL
jgi:quinol monooxygenase YgiN